MGGSNQPHRISRLAIFFAGASLLLFLFFLGIYWIFVFAPARTIAKGYEEARDIARELAAALPLEAIVRERTTLIFQPPQERAEWLAVEESFLVRHDFEHTFLGSVKRFEVEGIARVGMGFSFSEEWTLRLEPDSNKAFLSLPEPRVLFVEVSNLQIRRDEDGWWNRLTASDREEALRQLEADARTAFDQDALGQRARNSLLQAMNRVLLDHGFTVEDTSTTSTPQDNQVFLP